MITSTGKACLADFGLSKLVTDSTWASSSNSAVGHSHELFTAPEILFFEPDESFHQMSKASRPKNPEKTTESDLYSFACVCYEVNACTFFGTRIELTSLVQIFTGNPRFSNIGNMLRRLTAIQENEVVAQPENMPDKMWELVRRCWERRPSLRPTATQFLQAFGIPKSRLQTEHEVWDSCVNPRVRCDPFNVNSRSNLFSAKKPN